MKDYGLNTSIWNNRLRIIFLITLMPAITFLVIFFGFFLDNDFVINEQLISTVAQSYLFSIPVLLIWLIIGIIFQRRIIFSFSGAEPVDRLAEPELYNIVENLCIRRGLTTPRIGIIEDSSMNAFATGWSKKDSWIVFSRGLIDNLEKEEIEAVAGHELTHIINEDVKTMVIANVFVGIIGTVGEILMRTSSSKRNSNEKGSPLLTIGLILYILGIFVFPLVNLVISRKKEYIADAGSVKLTGNRDAMINALVKIAVDPKINSVIDQNNGVKSMFIYSPEGIKRSLTSMFSTHPDIEDRIDALKMY